MIGQTLSLAEFIKELSRNKKPSSRPWNFKLHNLRKDRLPPKVQETHSEKEKVSLRTSNTKGRKGPKEEAVNCHAECLQRLR